MFKISRIRKTIFKCNNFIDLHKETGRSLGKILKDFENPQYFSNFDDDGKVFVFEKIFDRFFYWATDLNTQSQFKKPIQNLILKLFHIIQKYNFLFQ